MSVDVEVRPQNLVALEKAQAYHRALKAYRDLVKGSGSREEGARRVAALLLDPPEDCTLRIGALLQKIPGVGVEQARKMYTAAGLKGTEALAGTSRDLARRPGMVLTVRQREMMALRVVAPPENRYGPDQYIDALDDRPYRFRRTCSECGSGANVVAPRCATEVVVLGAFWDVGRLGPDGPLCWRCSDRAVAS